MSFVIQFIRCIAGNSLGIILNCMHEEVRPYHYSVLWNDLLEPWIICPYPEIRLQCKFILGRLAFPCAIIPSSSPSLQLDEKDMLLLLSLLSSAVHSPDLMTQQFDWEFSAAELVAGFESISLNPKNCTQILQSGITPLLLALLHNCDVTGKVEVCKLLWTLMDMSSSFSIESSSLLDSIEVLQNEDDANLRILSISLRIASAMRPGCSAMKDIGM